ncbi:MAG: hypothetical protein Q8J69_07635 [Sphingobacteriaceae bacterium]|nr:hypothetical protein [Sphingobacteriaceae bacterium]
MPKINKHFELDVTPERFLEACSVTELQEVELLLYSPRFQAKIKAEKNQMQLFNQNQNEHQTPTE